MKKLETVNASAQLNGYAYLDEYVRRGIGELHIGLTDNGDIGIWDHNDELLGAGDTIEEAAADAGNMELEAKQDHTSMERGLGGRL